MSAVDTLIDHLEVRAAEFWDTVQGQTPRGQRYNTGRVTGRDGYDEGLRIYKLLRLGVRFRPDWPLEITGVFAEVREIAEAGSSDRKLSPLSV